MFAVEDIIEMATVMPTKQPLAPQGSNLTTVSQHAGIAAGPAKKVMKLQVPPQAVPGPEQRHTGNDGKGVGRTSAKSSVGRFGLAILTSNVLPCDASTFDKLKV